MLQLPTVPMATYQQQPGQATGEMTSRMPMGDQTMLQLAVPASDLASGTVGQAMLQLPPGYQQPLGYQPPAYQPPTAGQAGYQGYQQPMGYPQLAAQPMGDVFPGVSQQPMTLSQLAAQPGAIPVGGLMQ